MMVLGVFMLLIGALTLSGLDRPIQIALERAMPNWLVPRQREYDPSLGEILSSSDVPAVLTTFLIYAAAAVAEIAGCFAFWAWTRQGQAMWWLIPGAASLLTFAWLLTLAPSSYAGRAYAAYGGVYILASFLWLWMIEGRRPDQWDLAGGALALIGAAVILFAPRSA